MGDENRKLEADKAEIEAKYIKVLKFNAADTDDIDTAVAAARKSACVGAAKEKALTNGNIRSDTGDKVQTKESEELAESIKDEATAETAKLGDTYKAAAKKVEEYINAGVEWTDWHMKQGELKEV